MRFLFASPGGYSPKFSECFLFVKAVMLIFAPIVTTASPKTADEGPSFSTLNGLLFVFLETSISSPSLFLADSNIALLPQAMKSSTLLPIMAVSISSFGTFLSIFCKMRLVPCLTFRQMSKVILFSCITQSSPDTLLNACGGSNLVNVTLTFPWKSGIAVLQRFNFCRLPGLQLP